MTDRQNGSSRRSPIRILLVDDHAIVRHGMMHLLNEVDGFEVYREAATVADALRLAQEDPPDLLVMEFAMEGDDGLEFIRRMARESEDLPILVLSAQEETLYAERALRAGARGYVMKEASTDVILEAVQAVARGEVFVSDRIRNRLVHRLAGGRPQMVAHPLEVLTDREVEVFRQLGAGLSTREVGARLGISVKTVETHRAKIMRKLDLDNASQLVHRAIAWTHFGESAPDE
jgi:DNA-binding NarL/FixJ family response regulator